MSKIYTFRVNLIAGGEVFEGTKQFSSKNASRSKEAAERWIRKNNRPGRDYRIVRTDAHQGKTLCQIFNR